MMENTSMRSRSITSAFLTGLFLLSAFQIKCKGPYQYETHPVIWVNAFEFRFSASEIGPDPSPQILKIKNAGVETMNYTLSDDANWLNVSPTSGSSNGQVNDHLLTIDKRGMTARAEAYEAKIVVSSREACNSPQDVKVFLLLTKEPPPQISVTPSQLTFIASASGTNPAPQTIRIRNSGQQTLNYTIADDAEWLDVSPTSGSSTGGENSHSVAVSISGLAIGTYTGTVTISDPNAVNSPQTVSVTLEIRAALPPMIAVSPSSLNFEARVGGPSPAPQSIRIRNSGQGTLNYLITDNAAWLEVYPSSGTSTGQEVSHAVSVDSAGLSTGTYRGVITVTSAAAANSPQVLDVTLVVSAIPTNNEIAISCSPTAGQTGTVVDFPITILGNTNEIKAFGLEVTFDATMFELVSVSKGSLTGNWAQVTGNVVSAGRVRIGAWAGDPSFAVRVGSSGSIALLKLRVTCSGCSDGRQSQVCMSNFTDDIVGMRTAPGCTTFTFKK